MLTSFAGPTVDAELVLDLKCDIGEGLFWDVDEKCVRFLDINGKKLFAYSPDTESLESWDTPERPGTWAKCTDNPDMYVVAFETGFYMYYPHTKEMRKIGGEIDNSNGGRLNDGRCDYQGRLVCGGYNDGDVKSSYVYQVVASKVNRMSITPSGKVCVANGTSFAPDGRTMYFCDTPDKIIWAYDYDPDSGKATNRRDFVNFAKQDIPGLPDGATVDSEGGVWSCCITAGRVIRFAPDGSVSYVVKCPTLFPTCPALCGENMDVLYITSLSYGADEKDRVKGGSEEFAGGLFRVKVPFQGVPEPKFLSKEALKKPRFVKVKTINPESKGVNLIVKCVKEPVAVEGRDNLKEAVCGDDTGVVTISLRSDSPSAVCQVGDSIRVQNAHVRMVKGFIRLAVDKWSAFKVVDAAAIDFEAVDEKKDVSAVEYELS